MELINSNLNLLGVKHDNFVYESKLINNKTVLKIVKNFKKHNLIKKFHIHQSILRKKSPVL